MRHSLLAFSLCILLCASCHPGRPSGVLDEDDMERVLYDYHVAQAMADHTRDSMDYWRHAYVQKVFEKHGITEEMFDSSMVYYTTNTSLLYDIYNRLYERLDAEAIQAGSASSNDAYSLLTAEGDTANLWMGDKMLVLQQATSLNSHTFSYVADTTFMPGDEFIFHGRTVFLQRDGMREAVLALTLHYDDDSTATVVRTVRGDGEFNLTLTANRTLNLRSVDGFAHFPATDNRDGTPRRMFVFNPVLVRIHHYVSAKAEPVADPQPAAVVDTTAAHVEDNEEEKLDVVQHGTRNTKVDAIRDSLRLDAKKRNEKRRLSSRKNGRRNRR